MKKALQYLHVSLVSGILVTLPLFGCKQTKLSPSQSADVQTATQVLNAAVKDGNAELAEAAQRVIDQINDEANEAQTTSAVDFVLDFLPVPDGYKKVVGGSLAALITQFAFPRPRRLYIEALKSAAKGVGSAHKPVEAGKALAGAVASIVKVWGLADSRPDVTGGPTNDV